MKKPTVTEFNCETQEEIVREMTDEEFEQHKKDVASIEENKAAKLDRENQRQAIADRLGLTADELKILLG